MAKRLFIILLFVWVGWPLIALAAAQPKPNFTFNVEGVSDPALANIKIRLKTLSGPSSTPLSPKEIQTIYHEAPEEIKLALQPFGFFSPTIQSSLTQEGQQWVAHYRIIPGQQVKLAHVVLSLSGEGQNDPLLQTILKSSPLKSGDPFNANLYNTIKKKLLETAVSQGYLDAKFAIQEVKINRQALTADEALELQTGPQYYFGDVSFSSSPFNSKFLRRYLPFKQGAPYRSDDLLRLQQNLLGSGYFAQVNITSGAATANREIPLEVKLTLKKKIQYSLGLGYGTDTGPRGTLGLDLRWLNSLGQNFKTTIIGSKIQNSLTAQYIIPGKNPLTQQYYVSGSVGQEAPPNNSQGVLQKVSVGYLTKIYGWTQNFSLNAQHEHYNLNDGPYLDSHLLYPQITWSKNNYDDLLFPLKGGSINVTALGTAEEIGSSSTFLQTEVKTQYVYSLTEKNRFVFRGDVGYTLINELENLPLSLQFFAGGAQSVRAYQYEGLGPGRTLAVGSAEYQREVYNKWYATVFYDIGNAADHIFHCTSADQAAGINCGFKSSPGVGVLWASPVGPLELTLADAINESGPLYKKLQISFNMGMSL